MRRGMPSVTLLLAALSGSTSACTIKSGPDPALLARCAPEVDMFAPSVTWTPPTGTRQKARVVPFEQRPILERDFEAEYLAEHHGIAPLDELMLPDGTSELRAWFPGCVLHGVLISRAGDRWAAAGLVNSGELIALEPVGTWPVLWDRLLAEGLLNLHDQKDFRDQPVAIHPTVYEVQIHRDGQYREYEWLSPELSSLPEARAVVRIARVLRENLRAQWTL
jgi:hypothetical protein